MECIFLKLWGASTSPEFKRVEIWIMQVSVQINHWFSAIVIVEKQGCTKTDVICFVDSVEKRADRPMPAAIATVDITRGELQIDNQPMNRQPQQLQQQQQPVVENTQVIITINNPPPPRCYSPHKMSILLFYNYILYTYIFK